MATLPSPPLWALLSPLWALLAALLVLEASPQRVTRVCVDRCDSHESDRVTRIVKGVDHDVEPLSHECGVRRLVL